ncbi:beta-lactamase family protein [Geodermatophilus sp. YIM 151500]|uniref:serine hydrolase domain-containing protein n=1 Tax=Geodermatophilus sp. YIM 151500 TaxID=2984531 RepID=UPI0021E48093|nr:serine hydrolase domain-containing protein [Geodermatophilus sp. YIM 151500]MCV2491277.1 beta-lactamase family protein [Geodermatophilus sp. YIM 151500]
MEGIENVPAVPDKVPVAGTCADRFSPVRDAFAYNLGTGQDVGASVAVFLDGEPVVDLWGGYFDGTYTRPFGADTIVQGYSTTKTVTALCALVLADWGKVDLDAPVARYWPEFAAEGKADVEVRQLLGHTSGLCGWDVPMTLRDVYDREKSTALLARQAPLWKPGRTSGYHGMNQGHLVGEVIRRVTGKTLGTFLQEDVAGPLGVAPDYHIGTPPAFDDKVSPLIQGAQHDPATDNRFHSLALQNPHQTPQDTWALEWRRAEIGALNGHGNARGLATMQSVLACGSANGVQMMSDAGRLRALEQQSDGVDLVLGVPCRWAMGYSLETSIFPWAPPDSRAAWWAGNGGAMSFVDLDARLAIGFTPNRWISGPHEQTRSRRIIAAAYQSLAG